MVCFEEREREREREMNDFKRGGFLSQEREKRVLNE